MEKNRKPKEIITQILDMAGYGENKEEFADQLLTLCQQQAFVDLIKSLPEETQTLLENSLSDQPNSQNIDQVLKDHFTEEEILQSLKKATENIIKNYLQTISSHLSDSQKNNLQTYMQSLDNATIGA